MEKRNILRKLGDKISNGLNRICIEIDAGIQDIIIRSIADSNRAELRSMLDISRNESFRQSALNCIEIANGVEKRQIGTLEKAKEIGLQRKSFSEYLELRG